MSDTLAPGALVTLTPEKPVAGGRMLARLDGRIILVSGAIPGEPVRARIEKVEKSLAFAEAVEILELHPTRRPVTGDPRCGGASYAHIAYADQIRFKADVIRDALKRLARIDAPESLAVAASAEQGYRMRSRLHWRDGVMGFFLEGTHRVCDAAPSGQLLPETLAALGRVAERIRAAELEGEADLDVSENITADSRVVHINLSDRSHFKQLEQLSAVAGVSGLSWSDPTMKGDVQVYGSPYVVDRMTVGQVADGPANPPVELRRHVQAFFQANRFLLERLVGTVVGACLAGPVLDLYAGVGLFGVTLAATGRHRVTAVEGQPASASDLGANAEPYRASIGVYQMSVEDFIAKHRDEHVGDTLVLDPPRSGMSKEAFSGVLSVRASRIVFVSCDVATFARDLGRFVQTGYHLSSIEGFDLFPNTPHVEAVAVLER